MAAENASLEQLGQEFGELRGKPRSPMGDAVREFKRNKVAMISVAFIIVVTVLALFAPIFTPYGFNVQNTSYARAKPMTPYVITTDKYEMCHWKGTPFDFGCTVYILGADGLGRDLLSRVIYGSRISLLVAIIGSSVSLIIGTVYGVISGYFGGKTDDLMMRIVDFLWALPVLVIIIIMTVYFKALARAGATGFAGFLIDLDQAMGGLLFMFIAIGALSWLGMARQARGQILSHKKKEYVEAARSIGAGSNRIIFRHLLPNIIGPLLVLESMAIPGYIGLEAFLSFIGLGVNPPTPSWGIMISEGYLGIKSNPHLVLVPGTALTLLTLAFNYMGDGIRDAIDPRIHGR